MPQWKSQCHPRLPFGHPSHRVKFASSVLWTLAAASAGPELAGRGDLHPSQFRLGSRDTPFPPSRSPPHWQARPPWLQRCVSLPRAPPPTARSQAPGSGTIFTHFHIGRTSHGVWHTAGASTTTKRVGAITADGLDTCSRHGLEEYLVSFHHPNNSKRWTLPFYRWGHWDLEAGFLAQGPQWVNGRLRFRS